MATTIKITVKSIKGNPIKGLTVKAYTPKEKAGFGKAKKTNANGEVALDTTQKVDFGKDAIFFRVFEGNRLLKTSEKVIGNKNVVLKINPVKLSMLSLPEKEIDKLVDKEIKKELQLRLTDYLYGSIVVQLKDKDNKGLKVLKEQISKLVEEEKFKKGDRQLSTILKKTINSLKKNSRTKVLVEHVVVPEEKEKQSLESFLRLGEAVNKSSWFSDKLKKEAFEKAAGLPFVKADKKEDFKTALDKSLTRDDLIKELIDKEIVAKEYKSKLELWLDASSVLGDHQLIENILKDGTIKTARDLVMLRSKPQEVKRKIVGWEDLIDEDNDLPINGNREDYISLLEDRIAARYPYAFMMDRLVQGDFVDKKNKEQEKRVYKYFNTEKDKHKAVLEGFFNDFPDMDLQKTDLLKNTFYYSKKGGEWKKRKRNSKKINGEINKHLLAMQRIFSLAPTYPLAAAMLKAGFYAAADVSKVPMKELRKRMQAVGVNTEMAQQSIVRLKARAERSVSQTMYLLGNAHALFSNQYTSTNVDITNGVRQELQKELERIPGYEDHFGPQNYCKCAHCQSIFSPGAYFVDLMQYIKWAVEYNGNNNVLPLKARRNDLWEIAINCENAHKEIPYLEVVNEVLEKYAQGLITKGLEILKRNPPQGLKLANLNLYLSRLVADKNITLGNIKDTDVNIFRAIAYHETEAFSSFSLLQPTNLFLEASKLILGHFDLTLFDISEISDTVFDENKTRLYLGITKEEVMQTYEDYEL